jgi:hypothetical protein
MFKHTGPIGMHAVETSPGQIDLVCDVSNRPHTRTNQYGMFCDAPDCECEKRSMEAFGPMQAFINAAAGMLERREDINEQALMDAFFGAKK